MFAPNPGVNWVKQSVQGFQPKENALTLKNGDKYIYDYLVVAAGL